MQLCNGLEHKYQLIFYNFKSPHCGHHVTYYIMDAIDIIVTHDSSLITGHHNHHQSLHEQPSWTRYGEIWRDDNTNSRNTRKWTGNAQYLPCITLSNYSGFLPRHPSPRVSITSNLRPACRNVNSPKGRTHFEASRLLTMTLRHKHSAKRNKIRNFTTSYPSPSFISQSCDRLPLQCTLQVILLRRLTRLPASCKIPGMARTLHGKPFGCSPGHGMPWDPTGIQGCLHESSRFLLMLLQHQWQ